ncbi:MAG: 4-(cytidine 5'-diphospho)-2-C-methyl-D-erythritol kinase, partial [Hyphomicrobiales bacterium]|nr:4-(cytidine 5'-diphospho)-2-C-methyl-D-erythritol kinase [Hyphomicrobiales bacterium]
NDLEAPAIRLAPVIGEVKAALAAAPGCRIAGLSGSGATCFGIFGSQAQAQVAATQLSSGCPDWWVQASILQ